MKSPGTRTSRSPHPGYFRGTLLTVLSCVLVGCDRGSDTSTYAVRDSADVRIVESSAPFWGDGDGWTVSPEPVLQIGVVEGAEEYQFSFINGLFEEDGRIVVGDFRSSEVRFFDLEGSYLGAFGRQGDGPGEFGQLQWVWGYRGDSLVAWDQRGRRLSFFDRDGTFVRSVAAAPVVRPEPAAGAEQVIWTVGGLGRPLADGTFLGFSGETFRGRLGERVVGEGYFIRFSAEGDSLGSLGPFGGEMEIRDFGQRPMIQTPFARLALSAPHAGGVYVTPGAALEVHDLSFERGLQRIIRASHLDLRATDEHIRDFMDSERLRLAESAEPGAIERALAEVRFPATIPPSAQIEVDAEQHLWVRHYKLRSTPGPEQWSVFDAEGVLLAVVETPERLLVRQIGSDFVLGIWTDELDVRYVRKYALER